MDLFDIIGVTLRRWYVSVPIFVLGAALAAYASTSIAQVYEVESQYVVVGPSLEDNPEPADPEDLDRQVNPYARFTGSLDVTAQAIMRIVDGVEFRKMVADEGLDGEYEFGASPGTALILLTNQAGSADEAAALAERLSEGLSTTLSDIQAESGVPEDRQIILRTLTISDPEDVSGSPRLILVGGLAIAIGAAIMGAMVADGLASARARRSRGTTEEEGDSGDSRGSVEDEEDGEDTTGSPSEHDPVALVPPVFSGQVPLTAEADRPDVRN